MRPSSSLCQYFAGYCSAMLIGSSISVTFASAALAPFLYGETRELDVIRPEVSRQSGLVLEQGEEDLRVGRFRPCMRQKGGAAGAALQRHPIQPRIQFAQSIL